MGYFDGRDFDSAVLIRYIENRDGQLYYRSGGGITFMSDPEKEYRELLDKVYIPVDENLRSGIKPDQCGETPAKHS